MKNNKLTFLKIAIVAVLGVATGLGCEKNEKIQKIEPVKSEGTISIIKLKEFLALIGNVPADSIQYDDLNEQFIWRGKPQISKTDLIFVYEQNKGVGAK